MKEIFINSNKDNSKTILFVENGIITEQYREYENDKRLEQNIYAGKVVNILNGMQAAFIDIGEEKHTFIHLKDILPKVDSVKDEEVNLENKKISDFIKVGEKILVQVKRDSTSSKGARVSSHINIANRFCALMPNTTIVTVSQKIENNKERERLIKIVKEFLPDNFGAIIRTSAKNKSKEEIEEDLNQSINKWNEIYDKYKRIKKKFPVILSENGGITKKILTDLIDQNLNRIVTNSDKIIDELKVKLEGRKIELVKKEDLLDIYDVGTQLEKLQNRKIWLKSGGFITIDQTEALTAIDVNSGKYVGKENLEKTVVKVNQEASVEIAKQLRLRDIGGIIIIDYIDMQKEESKQKIIDILKENLKNDRSKTQVEGFSKLNLLEMTRKHICSN